MSEKIQSLPKITDGEMTRINLIENRTQQQGQQQQQQLLLAVV